MSEKTRIQKTAMLVKLSLTHWDGSTTDRPVTSKVIHDHRAKRGTGRFTKKLVDKDFLAPIVAATDRIRELHFKLTMPWDDSGDRLLPVSAMADYTADMDALFAERTKAVRQFDLTEAKRQAEEDLGDLYRASDYPHIDEIRDRFSAKYEIKPIPDGSHFVANVGHEEAERIKRDIEAHVQHKLGGAVSDLYRRLGEAVQETADKLTPNEDGSSKRFRGNILDKLKEVCDLASTLNVTEDAGVTMLANDVRKAIAGISADMLRPKSKEFDAAARRKIETDLGGLSDKFAGYFGAAPPAAD